jgi:transcriptional regulator with XRE-family HTH domain
MRRTGDGAVSEEVTARIRARRKSLGLSAQNVADLCPSVSRSMIAKMETDGIRVTVDVLVEVAHALDTTPAELLGVTARPFEFRSRKR